MQLIKSPHDQGGSQPGVWMLSGGHGCQGQAAVTPQKPTALLILLSLKPAVVAAGRHAADTAYSRTSRVQTAAAAPKHARAQPAMCASRCAEGRHHVSTAAGVSSAALGLWYRVAIVRLQQVLPADGGVGIQGRDTGRSEARLISCSRTLLTLLRRNTCRTVEGCLYATLNVARSFKLALGSTHDALCCLT